MRTSQVSEHVLDVSAAASAGGEVQSRVIIALL